MSTSEKTFTQVKDILRKLERSIDQAREKRLHHDDDALGAPVPHQPPARQNNPAPGAPGAPGAPTGPASSAVRSGSLPPARPNATPGWMSR